MGNDDMMAAMGGGGAQGGIAKAVEEARASFEAMTKVLGKPSSGLRAQVGDMNKKLKEAVPIVGDIVAGFSEIVMNSPQWNAYMSALDNVMMSLQATFMDNEGMQTLMNDLLAFFSDPAVQQAFKDAGKFVGDLYLLVSGQYKWPTGGGNDQDLYTPGGTGVNNTFNIQNPFFGGTGGRDSVNQFVNMMQNPFKLHGKQVFS